MLATAFEAVLERHLEPVAPADLMLWSLRGLSVLEPRIEAELRDGQLRLLTGGGGAAGGEVGVLAARRLLPPPPPPQAAMRPPPLAPALAETMALLFEAAWQASLALQRAGADAMLRSAFEELFNHLDPYSRYVTPQEAAAARERRVGQAGLGLRLAAGRGDAVVIASVAPGGPAAQAGLRVGDQVLAIDGQTVSAADLAGAAARLEGPAETEAVLLVARPGRGRRGGRPREVLLVRSPVPPETVSAELRDGILWLRVTGFSNATDAQLARALAEAFGGGAGAKEGIPPRGVVLDLRGNRGGLLSQAVAVADLFLPGGEVARTVGRHPEAGRIYLAAGSDLAAGRPVVALVDGRSASAAEIVAAALADRGRGVVVGSATTGKGLIQLLVPLPNDADLVLSWSRVTAPRGWPIQALGVLPAVCTSLGAEATTQALARLRAGEAPMATALARLRAARAPVPASEVAALRGACPPAEGRETDLAAARFLLDHPAAYQTARLGGAGGATGR